MIRIKLLSIALLGIAIGAVSVMDKPEPVLTKAENPIVREIRYETPTATIESVEAPPVSVIEIEPEEWYGKDRKLTDYEWGIMGQTIMAEARGESHEVQYYIACVILNRVDSDLFPNTVAGVIYQTEPIQFCGAWDSEKYEVSDSVNEAIQEALIHNALPEDTYYFTSNGYLSNTEPYMQIGNMWFSRQRGD